ncbi:cytochrome P450 [Falsiroseomonas sp. HW251]|uniref:cytochrome P450 n=1 Tax=Falsiroseomonas sp. HW251 TaxID=3390998 RepID=UPI003D316D3A
MPDGATMDAPFVPPMPVPRESLPGPLGMLRIMRRNLLELFLARTYSSNAIAQRMLGHRIIVVNHPELVREIFVLKHETYQRKSRFMEQALRPVVGDSLFINHGTVWAERREPIAAALHPSGVGAFHPLFAQAAEELAREWERAEAVRDIAFDLSAATARVVMLATFGPDAPAGAAAALARDFAAYQDAVESLDYLAMLGLPEWVPSVQRRTALAAARRMRALAAGLMEAGRPGPLLSAMRKAARPDGQPLMRREALLNEVCMLLLAGSETSANALGWALYLAFAHPPTLKRLRAEVEAVLGARTSPAAEDLPALPFTRAVVQEALRLYPPVAVLSRQATAPDLIRRWAVKPGMTVAAIPWLLHRHEALWEAPHEFRPERFMPDAPKPPRFGYIPFGIGPRVCAGAAFGQAEMTVFLATLVRRVGMRVAPGHVVMPRLRLTLRAAGGMRMVVRGA